MINQAGLDLIKSREGCSLVAYQDGNQNWSIGYGRAHGVKPGDTCTQMEAVAWLLEDLAEAELRVHKLVKVELNENQLAALISFTFNEGYGRLKESTLLHCINCNQWESAADSFLPWNKIAGVPNDGLIRRRQAERDLFLTPVQNLGQT